MSRDITHVVSAVKAFSVGDILVLQFKVFVKSPQLTEYQNDQKTFKEQNCIFIQTVLKTFVKQEQASPNPRLQTVSSTRHTFLQGGAANGTFVLNRIAVVQEGNTACFTLQM